MEPGLHVARFSTNTAAPTASFSGTVSNGRLTIGGTAVVTIAGGLYNSTGFLPTSGTYAGIPQPGGVGLIEMTGGTLTAGSFLNGGAANVGTPASANYVQTGGTASRGHVTGTGTLSIAGGSLSVKSLRQGQVNITSNGAVTVAADGTAAGTSIIDDLVISGSGKLDLTDNDLVVNNGNFVAIQAQVLAGFGTNTAITSSTSTGVEILALFDNAQVGATDWNGLTIGPNAVVGKYTYFGDVNIDGQVSGDDYTIVDSNLGLGSGNPLAPQALAGGVAAVPEPASVALLSLGALTLLRRRRRTN